MKTIIRSVPVFLSIVFAVLSRGLTLFRVTPPPAPPIQIVAVAEEDAAASQPETKIALETPIPVDPVAPDAAPPERRREDLSSRGAEKRKVTATAYTKSDAGGEITFTGTKVMPWHTVAVAPSTIPLGYWIYIPYFADAPNKGWFHAEDTGGAIRGDRIDIYMEDRKEALQFGVCEVEIMVRETPPW